MAKSPSFPSGRVGAAAVICGVVLGACASPASRQGAGPDVTRPPTPGRTAPITASPGSKTASAHPSPKPSGQRSSSIVSAIAEPPVTFTADTVTTFAQVSSSTPVPLVIVRADFGDGSGIVTLPATACGVDSVQQPGVVNSPAVSHRYARPGQHTIRIWARLGCAINQSVQYATTAVYAYPSAPPGAAGWQRCQPGQLSATFTPLGAATGNVSTQIVFRNVSAVPCHLYGFPGLQMLDAAGAALPTTVDWGASYLFPALNPHLVGLAPAQAASFDLGYGDNPTGNPPPPYRQACPAAATLVIIPPDDFTSLRARVAIAPCNGDLTVSPVVPGTTPIPFS